MKNIINNNAAIIYHVISVIIIFFATLLKLYLFYVGEAQNTVWSITINNKINYLFSLLILLLCITAINNYFIIKSAEENKRKGYGYGMELYISYYAILVFNLSSIFPIFLKKVQINQVNVMQNVLLLLIAIIASYVILVYLTKFGSVKREINRLLGLNVALLIQEFNTKFFIIFIIYSGIVLLWFFIIYPLILHHLFYKIMVVSKKKNLHKLLLFFIIYVKEFFVELKKQWIVNLWYLLLIFTIYFFIKENFGNIKVLGIILFLYFSFVILINYFYACYLINPEYLFKIMLEFNINNSLLILRKTKYIISENEDLVVFKENWFLNFYYEEYVNTITNWGLKTYHNFISFIAEEDKEVLENKLIKDLLFPIQYLSILGPRIFVEYEELKKKALEKFKDGAEEDVFNVTKLWLETEENNLKLKLIVIESYFISACRELKSKISEEEIFESAYPYRSPQTFNILIRALL